jgi:hypothetical protein
MVKAAPRQSKPTPILAVVAGTVTVTLFIKINSYNKILPSFLKPKTYSL